MVAFTFGNFDLISWIHYSLCVVMNKTILWGHTSLNILICRSKCFLLHSDHSWCGVTYICKYMYIYLHIYTDISLIFIFYDHDQWYQSCKLLMLFLLLLLYIKWFQCQIGLMLLLWRSSLECNVLTTELAELLWWFRWTILLFYVFTFINFFKSLCALVWKKRNLRQKGITIMKL